MKTTHLIIGILSLLIFPVMQAQNENILLIPDLQGGAGREAGVCIHMNNSAEIVAVQFELQLPRGFRLSDTTAVLLSDRKVNHGISVKNLGNFTYLVVIFSPSNELLMGNSGALAYLPVVVPDTCTEGTHHAFSFKNIVISGKSGENVVTGSQGGALEIIVTPRPDVSVFSVNIEKGSASPGEQIQLSWVVRNDGNLSTGGGWSEQLSLVTSSGESTHLGTIYYTGLLSPGESVSRQGSFTLSGNPGIDGDAQAQVKLIPNKSLGELPSAGNNNTAQSAGKTAISKQLTLLQNRTHIPENDQGYVQYQLIRSGSRIAKQTFPIVTDKSGRLQVPDSVTINSGNSGVVFYGKPIDNEQINMDSVIIVTAAGNEYTSVSGTLIIVDNEVPGLSITPSNTALNEGDTLYLTVERQLQSSDELKLTLQTNYPKRFAFSKEIIIPGNQKTVQIPVKVIDDNLPDLNVAAGFIVSAASYQPARCDVIVNDNDIPELELIIGPDSVSESAGYQAAIGIVKREGNTDQIVYVRLTDNADGLIYYNTPTVTLSRGQKEARFTIGVVDNTTVDGNKNLVLTAAVFITHCNCTVVPESAGSETASLVVLDDDGPALKIVSSQSMLPEGNENATVLSISRNTAPTSDLTITLSSNRDEQLNYEKQVTLVEGQTTVTVNVGVLSNNIPEGDQMVSFTARSDGYSNGFCWAMISDQTLADAQIAIDQLSADTVETKGVITLLLRITNSGLARLSYGKEVEIFLSSTPRIDNQRKEVGSAFTARDIAPGKSDTLSLRCLLPDLTGTHYLFAEINAKQQQKELSYLNNNSVTKALTLTPAYSVSLLTDKSLYQTTDTVVISGSARRPGGESVVGMPVEIYLIGSAGKRISYSSVTDTNGNYFYRLVPGLNTLGRFSIGACYPGEGSTIGTKTIDILGLKRISSSYITWEVLTGETYTGEIEIMNPGISALTNLTTYIETSIEGLSLNIDPIAYLAPGAATKLTYRLVSTIASTKSDYEKIRMVTRSSEGAQLEMTGYYISSNPRATLKSSVGNIATTMTKGAIRNYEFTVTNTGKGESGNITLSIPATNWLSLVSPVSLPSLKNGESTTIVLQFSPGNDLALNVPVSGTIGINCQNGAGIALPFRIEPVSEATGNLTIDVCDEYTYYTDEAPHVAGARVTLRHPYTNAIITEGVTGNNGIFSISNLPEGYYKINITADKHDSYSNNILIDPGKTNTLVVNLSFQAITYSWEVVETEVEDEYELETIVKFETNVPTPVVEMIVPKEIDTEKLSIGESLVFNVILTNKGLITAKDVEVVVPGNMQTLTFEPLFNMIELKPQESVMIPVTVTKIASPTGVLAKATASTDNCKEYIMVIYMWDCGLDRKWHQYAKEISLGTWCTTISNPTPPSNWSGYSLHFGGWGGGWGGNYSGSSSQTTPTISVSDCEPCQNSFAYKMAKCFIKRIPIVSKVLTIVETVQCAYEVIENGDLSCVVQKVITENEWIDKIIGYKDLYDDCLKPILEPCEPGSFVREPKGVPSATQQAMPSYTAHFQEVMGYVYRMATAHEDQLLEIFGDSIWLHQTGKEVYDFWQELISYKEVIPTGADLKQFRPTGISEVQYETFISRWNNTRNNQYTGDQRIDFAFINQLLALQKEATAYAESLGYSSVGEMFEKEYVIYEKEASDNSGSVCATITLKFSQTMTMTRQAFRGTLTVFNGHESEPMKDVELNLVVTDENEVLATSHEFQITTEKLEKLSAIDGSGLLAAKETGIATILFIPTKYAAPETPQEYSFGGTLSYTDPFTGTRVSRDLYPVTLTVKPSPDLVLNYFMQRDVMGDDPLTPDITEPSEDAEFTLLIYNEGAGDATNVKIASKQPEIIENEKGLLIDFEIVSSSLNGTEKNIGITNIDFGTIPAGKTSYGQWWFRSSLLGHFVEYDTRVTHVTSYDNPDLSLVKSIDIHELISSIEVKNGSEMLRGFLANDVVDTYDYPDRIYLSDGTNTEINTINSVQVSSTGDYQQQLTITADTTGWNYAVIADPYNGRAVLNTIQRISDGMELPVGNIRQTTLTLRDGKDPIHENKLHFIDKLATSEEHYILNFSSKRDNILDIVSIATIPVEVSQQPVGQLDITFNRAILDSTFTNTDLKLSCQGIEINVEKVSISKLNSFTYRIHLDSVTHTNGYFLLTVNTTAIKDDEGYPGTTGRNAGWIQFLDGAVQVSVQVIPENSGIVSPQTGAYTYGEPVVFKATAKTGYQFKHWSTGSDVLSAEPELTFIPLENKIIQALFELKRYLIVTSCDTTMGLLTGNSSGVYIYGSTLYLTAMPLTNYEFKGWEINGILTETHENTLTTDIIKDMNIKAVFRLKEIPTNFILPRNGTLHIYPNPARESTEITLVLPEEISDLSNISLRMLDLTGRVVREETVEQLQTKIRGLLQGIYLVQLINDGQVYAVKKILIR